MSDRRNRIADALAQQQAAQRWKDIETYNRIMTSPPTGQVVPGTVDLNRRPMVYGPDGSISTVRSMSFGQDGREVLVPTISDEGRFMSPDEAIRQYDQTGQHLGIFSDPAAADAYAQKLHEDQYRQYFNGIGAF